MHRTLKIEITKRYLLYIINTGCHVSWMMLPGKGSGFSVSSTILGLQTRNKCRASGIGAGANSQSHGSQLCAALPNSMVMLVAWNRPEWERLHHKTQQTPHTSIIFPRKWVVQYVPAHHRCRRKTTGHSTRNSGRDSKGCVPYRRATRKYWRTSLWHVS